jgi:hypothetical protein
MGQNGLSLVTALTASSVGLAVKASGSFTDAAGLTVALVTENDAVAGRLEVVEGDGGCTVASKGIQYYPFVTGVTPTQGQGVVGGATAGYVKSATHANGGRGYVWSIDLTNLKCLVEL